MPDGRVNVDVGIDKLTRGAKTNQHRLADDCRSGARKVHCNFCEPCLCRPRRQDGRGEPGRPVACLDPCMSSSLGRRARITVVSSDCGAEEPLEEPRFVIVSSVQVDRDSARGQRTWFLVPHIRRLQIRMFCTWPGKHDADARVTSRLAFTIWFRV